MSSAENIPLPEMYKMAGNPLVSVLMTAFNRESFIGEAIQSVLDSSYTNFELIIVDDHSTDRTVEIAQCFEEKDNRVKVFVNERQLGDYPNRNKAATYASGKYIKYVDSDDFVYTKGLELMVNSMECFPEAGWGICSISQSPYINKPFPIMLSPYQAYCYNYTGPSGLFDKTPLSVIIKRDIFINSGGFKASRMVSDLEFWHRLGQKHNVVLMMEGLVWARVHDEQEMKDFVEYINTYESIRLKYLMDPDCPLSPEQVKRVLLKRKKGHFHLFAYYLLKLNLTHCRHYLRLMLLDYLNYRRLTKKGIVNDLFESVFKQRFLNDRHV